MASAHFAFTTPPGDKEFVIELTDDTLIAKARKILAGEEKKETHIGGRIKKETASYNPGWYFHLDPSTIRFFDTGLEVLDADASYTDDHIDEAGGVFLPGGHWYPQASTLTREV
ncbi:BP74-related protein [Streptomyces sp. H27-D2]|uniref:BP74-related protein n=1 Tax=Streptomyces sp. H27-D2 TaxID=3046304 RepID=UPI002DBE114D|nr:calmodulin [Streptomyces sp. H27-D2]MEC4020018.1 calmodulin [Streptomyces sp. H27-D2]